MSTVADLHAPTGTISIDRSDTTFVAVATVAYALSTIKWVGRDPLSTETGAQALIEVGLLGVAVLAAAVPIVRRRAVFPFPTPAVVGFALFAAFAMISSAFSYWPALSLVKGMLFLAVVSIALFLSTARPPTDVLRYLYWSILFVIVCGLCLKLTSGAPIFEVDDFSGRQRFTIFDWHANTFADLAAMALLIGRLLPRRPSWVWQVLLFGLVLMTGARAVGIGLALVLAVSSVWTLRRQSRTLAALVVAAAAVVSVGWTVYVLKITVASPAIAEALEGFYGNNVGNEVATINGRTELWSDAAPMLAETAISGYGIDGARAELLDERDWAGHAHNTYLELLLAAGAPGLLVFVLTWGIVVIGSLRLPPETRGLVLSLHVYIFLQGMAEPNLIALQSLPVFLIVCLDAINRDERWAVRHRSRGMVPAFSLR